MEGEGPVQPAIESAAAPLAGLASSANQPEPYTPYNVDRLLKIATEADQAYERLLKLHPPGTYNLERNDAHRLREDALACAAFLESSSKVAQLRHIGTFGPELPKKGDRVLIKRGAVVRSTRPGTPQEGVTLTRNTWVTLHYAHKGFISDSRHDYVEQRIRNPEVGWAGAGGYWRWTDVNNVAMPGAELEAALASARTAKLFNVNEYTGPIADPISTPAASSPEADPASPAPLQSRHSPRPR